MSIKVNIGKLKRMGAKIGCGFPDNCPKLSLLDEPPRVARAYLMTLSLKQAIMDVNWKNPLLSISAYLQLRFPFLGRTKRPMKRLLARMALTYKKRSYQPTGKHPSPRSASVCRLVNNSGSSSSTRQPNLCIHWSLTGNTTPLRWVVTRGRRLSVRKPPCSKTATWKGSMLKRVTPKQESAYDLHLSYEAVID